VLAREYKDQDCSIAGTLELIGERWTLLILREVMTGHRRFDQMQETLRVARNVLSARLQRLLDEGIVEKRPYQSRPERFEYFLTEKGLDLWPVLMALMGWGDRHLDWPDGPPVKVTHKDCGGRVDDRRICERCGKHLTVREARAVPRATVPA
jgi:DNA-binding HxlR family transcriptional regulator